METGQKWIKNKYNLNTLKLLVIVGLFLLEGGGGGGAKETGLSFPKRNVGWLRLIFQTEMKLDWNTRQRKEREEKEIVRTGRLCFPLKYDPRRLDYTELTPSVAGLVDDMIEGSDPGAKTSNQHCCRSIFGLLQTGWGISFLHSWATVWSASLNKNINISQMYSWCINDVNTWVNNVRLKPSGGSKEIRSNLSNIYSLK